MMETQACVIGAGPGGYVCAIRLAQYGIKTILVEKEPRLGGVCLNWGCIPSKAYIQAAKLWDQMGSASEIGIKVTDPEVDLAAMKKWKDGIVQRLTGGIADLMKRHKVDIVHGTATFTGKDTISVAGKDGKQTIKANNFVVATGSSSIDIPGFDVDEKTIVSSTGALDFESVPESLLVIGGGVIGLEIGQYLMKFGTKLTVVEMMDQLLPGTDKDCVKVVARKLKKGKAAVHLKSKAVGCKKSKGGVEVTFETPKKEETVTVEKVLVSVGRRPNSKGLGLEKAGVKVDQRGFIEVNDRLQSSNPNIYAIGDVAGPPLLAHKGSKEGLVAAAVISGKPEVMDVRAMPAAIFTSPEIAAVGMTEEEAKKAGHEINVGTFPMAASGRALAGRETDGTIKIIADKKTDLLLGAHFCGPAASELVAEASLAIEAGLCAEDLALTVHTHPTLAETVMEAAEDVHGMAVHIYNPKG